MDVSIYNTVKSSKVATGNAYQFASMRIFDEDAQVCPARANISDFGVLDVPRDSIVTLSSAVAGCYSPLNRMTVENTLRPAYSAYLNADAIAQIGDDDYATPNTFSVARDAVVGPAHLYDTLTGSNSLVRTVLPEEQMKMSTSFSNIQQQPNLSAEDKELLKINCLMSRNNQHCKVYS